MDWKVTGQASAPGGYEVTYQTDDGASHKLYIPQASFTVGEVKSAITADVANREAISTLTSAD